MKTSWSVVDHACRFCGGRILEQDGLFSCPTCGANGTGRVTLLCGCGVIAGRRLFRCALNPSPSPVNPARVIIALADGGMPAF